MDALVSSLSPLAAAALLALYGVATLIKANKDTAESLKPKAEHLFGTFIGGPVNGISN